MKNKTGFWLSIALAAISLTACCINWYTDRIIDLIPYSLWCSMLRFTISAIFGVLTLAMLGFAVYFLGNDEPGKNSNDDDNGDDRDEDVPGGDGGGTCLSLAEILEEEEAYA